MFIYESYFLVIYLELRQTSNKKYSLTQDRMTERQSLIELDSVWLSEAENPQIRKSSALLIVFIYRSIEFLSLAAQNVLQLIACLQ